MELPTWVEVMDPLRPAEHVSLGDREAREQSHSQQHDRSRGKGFGKRLGVRFDESEEH